MPEKICRKCKYDLMGLQSIGKCPECGSAYNQFTGEGMRNFADVQAHYSRVAGRIRTLALGGATLLVVAGFVVLALVRWQTDPLWFGLFFGGLLGLGTLVSFVYEKG